MSYQYEMNADLTIAMLLERNIEPDIRVVSQAGPETGCIEAWKLPLGLLLIDIWDNECEDAAIVGSVAEIEELLNSCDDAAIVGSAAKLAALLETEW